MPVSSTAEDHDIDVLRARNPDAFERLVHTESHGLYNFIFRMLRDLGCLDYRVVSSRRIAIDDPEVEARVGNIGFYSMTIRAFKLPEHLEDLCEDYGQVASYNGTLPHAPHTFLLDDHHVFETGRPVPVCGNTAAMVSETRYGQHFRLVGDRSVHYGAFDCAPATATANDDASPGGCC